MVLTVQLQSGLEAGSWVKAGRRLSPHLRLHII